MPVRASLKTVSDVPAWSIQGPHCFSQGYPKGLYLTCTDIQVEDLPKIPPHFCSHSTRKSVQPLGSVTLAAPSMIPWMQVKTKNFVSVIECYKS